VETTSAFCLLFTYLRTFTGFSWSLVYIFFERHCRVRVNFVKLDLVKVLLYLRE